MAILVNRKSVTLIHVLQYNYFNVKQRRHEMAALEMYEGKNQSNATVFSSFTAPKQPLVMRQSFIFPLPMYTMTTTITEKGITTKDILGMSGVGIIHSLYLKCRWSS